jgi:hypothetical protein
MTEQNKFAAWPETYPYKEQKLSIPEGEAAIVTRGDMTGINLILPIEKEQVPELGRYLAACTFRWRRDKQFVKEQLDYLDEVMAE